MLWLAMIQVCVMATGECKEIEIPSVRETCITEGEVPTGYPVDGPGCPTMVYVDGWDSEAKCRFMASLESGRVEYALSKVASRSAYRVTPKCQPSA